jgi:hypothetical protein
LPGNGVLMLHGGSRTPIAIRFAEFLAEPLTFPDRFGVAAARKEGGSSVRIRNARAAGATSVARP